MQFLAHQYRLHSSVQETTAICFMQNICTGIHAFIVFYRQNPMSHWIWMRNWKGSDPCCEKFHSALTSLGHISWSELIQQQCNNTVVERVQWKHSEPQCCISITGAANVAVRLLFSSLLKILVIKITEYHELYSSQMGEGNTAAECQLQRQMKLYIYNADNYFWPMWAY